MSQELRLGKKERGTHPGPAVRLELIVERFDNGEEASVGAKHEPGIGSVQN